MQPVKDLEDIMDNANTAGQVVILSVTDSFLA